MNRAGSAPGFWSRLPHSARTSSTRSAVTHSVSTPSRTSSDNPAHGCISSIMPTATCHRTIVRSPQATALGAGREVAGGDLQAGLHGQRRELMFPGPGAAAVGAARVSGDQQPPGGRVDGPARVVPPAADRLHSEGGGGMVGADVHPAGVGGQVVDAVRDRLAQLQVKEVVTLDADRIASGPPFTAAVVIIADQFLLLGVHADHRLAGIAVVPDLLVEVTELVVPVRDLIALDGLGVALQAEAFLPQQVSHRIGAGPVALPGELGRQRPQRLWPSTATATSDHRAHQAPPAPVTPAAAQGPG